MIILDLLLVLLKEISCAGSFDNFVIDISDVHDIVDWVAKVVLQDTTQDVNADV